jgi:hypothetical protein
VSSGIRNSLFPDRPSRTAIAVPICAALASCYLILMLPGQTQIDLSKQAKNLPASSGVTVRLDGTTVGQASTLDFRSGAGVVDLVNMNAQTALIQISADTAYLQTLAAEQAGSALACISSSNSTTAYSCAMTPTLTGYSTAMILHWIPDVAAAAGATLNVDTLGAKRIKMADGVTDAAGSVLAGRLYQIWYDGAGFRMPQ